MPRGSCGYQERRIEMTKMHQKNRQGILWSMKKHCVIITKFDINGIFPSVCIAAKVHYLILGKLYQVESTTVCINKVIDGFMLMFLYMLVHAHVEYL